MADEFHKADIGTLIILEVLDQDDAPVSLVGYSGLTLLIEKPSATVVERDADLYTDGTDGKIKYYSTANDFDEVGTFKFQAFVDLPDGQWHSDIKKKKVLDNLE